MKSCLCPTQIEQTLNLANQAAKGIMAFYQSDYRIDIKSDDSPVTQADIAASRLLESGLPRIADYPVLSEENTPKTPHWLDWETYWLIDPIDGTKHFINATGDFCICIALIHRNRAVFGLIYAPATDTAWLAQDGDKGVTKFQTGQQTTIANTIPTLITATLSADHLTDNMKHLLSIFDAFQWHQRGSALKYIDIIEGKATLYPKMWDTCEWDSAAGQCLLECAGGAVVHFDTGEPLRYGHKTSLLNPHFLAYAGLSTEQVRALLLQYQTLRQ